MKTLEEITEALTALKTQAADAIALGEADSTKFEEVKAIVDAIKPQVEALTAEKQQAEDRKALEDTQAELKTLSDVIEDLRKPSGVFVTGTREEDGKAVTDAYSSGDNSVFLDIRMANKGDAAARERLTAGFEGLSPEGKAMTEGTAAQGGYLVRPQVERQIVEALESDNVLRGLCSSLSVNTNSIQLDQLALSTTAGWVAELASKFSCTGITNCI